MNYKLQPAGEVTPPAPHAPDCSSNGHKIDFRSILRLRSQRLKKDCLTPDRLKRLNALGFVWKG